MADDIFGNMSNMSIDELGSSLLQRKAEQEREAAKKAKKNERIQQGLALLLMGQGIMKTQYKKRMKELEDFHKFETLNNEHKVKQLNMNATILNTIGNTWDGKGGLDGFKNSDDYIRFSKEVRPFVDQKIRAMTADEYDSIYGTNTYENTMDLATESYAKKYLDTDKKSGKANYLAYQDGLRELLGDEAIDLDKNELFQRAMGLSVDELTGYQRKNYQNVLAEYKAQGNLMGGFRRVLGLFNDDFKAKGGFDIFSKVTEDALAGPTIRDLNQAMNLKGMTNNIVSKALADASKSDTRWRERARGKRFENYRKNIGELYLPQMTNLIEEGRYPSELQTDTFIGKGNWEEFINDMSAGDKEDLILDTAALSLRLKEDRRFLESVYNETEGKKADGRSFNEFKAILDDESNRSMFAAMIVTDAGFRDESWNPFNWKNETYDSFGTLTKVYNKYNVSNMIGDGINVDKRGKVSLPESYIEAPKERKQAMLKSTVKDILATSKTENERNIKLSGELDSEINKYFGMDSQAFIEMLAQEEMTFDKPSRTDLEKVGFANMFGSDNLDFQFPFRIKSEINRLNKILDEGNISKNNKIKLEEQVNILERSLLYLENKPEPESKESKKIKELQTKLEQERDDLRPTEINRIENQIQDLLKIEDSDEKKKTRPSYINDEVLNLQRIHLEEKNKDGTSRFTYTNIEEAQDTLNELTEFVLEAESDGDFNAANPNSSARGGYQFTKDASQTAMNRVESKMGKKIDRFDEVRQTGDVRSLSESDQTLLFIGDILEKSGSDKYIQNLLDAKTPKEKRNVDYKIYYIIYYKVDSKGKITKIVELQTKFKLRKYFNE